MRLGEVGYVKQKRSLSRLTTDRKRVGEKGMGLRRRQAYLDREVQGKT